MRLDAAKVIEELLNVNKALTYEKAILAVQIQSLLQKEVENNGKSTTTTTQETNATTSASRNETGNK